MVFSYILGLIAVFAFGFIDYVGYNKIKPTWLYRVMQTIIQLSFYVLLYLAGGIWAFFTYFLLHWTFCSDFVYYLFYDTLKWYGGEYAGHAYETEVLGNQVYWAWWTPYGLLFRFIVGKKSEPIPGETLIDQAIVGLLITVAPVLVSIFLR